MLDVALLRLDRGGDVDQVIASERLRLGESSESSTSTVEKMVRELVGLDAQVRAEKQALQIVSKELAQEQKLGKECDRARLKEIKERKQCGQKKVKEIEDIFTAELGKLGNIVDLESPDRILGKLKDFQEPKGSPKLVGNVSLEEMKGKWCDETKHLPALICHEPKVYQFLCIGERKHSNYACVVILNALMKALRVTVEVLEPCELPSLASAFGFRLVDESTQATLATLSNETDYLGRAWGIRSGPKKQLQDRKKFVHTITLTLDNITNQSPDLLESLDLTLKDIDFWNNANTIHSLDSAFNLDQLEIFLKSHSYIGGHMLCEKDYQFFAQILQLQETTPIPSVQYPCISRWKRHLEHHVA